MQKNWNLDELKLRGLFRLVLTEVNNLKLELRNLMSVMQDSIDAMKAEVTRQSTVVASVKTLIDGFIAAAEEAKDDPVEMQALLDGFKANTEALAAAVPANTPAPPVEEPAPPTEEPPVQEPSE